MKVASLAPSFNVGEAAQVSAQDTSDEANDASLMAELNAELAAAQNDTSSSSQNPFEDSAQEAPEGGDDDLSLEGIDEILDEVEESAPPEEAEKAERKLPLAQVIELAEERRLRRDKKALERHMRTELKQRRKANPSAVLYLEKAGRALETYDTVLQAGQDEQERGLGLNIRR